MKEEEEERKDGSLTRKEVLRSNDCETDHKSNKLVIERNNRRRELTVGIVIGIVVVVTIVKIGSSR